MMCVSAERQMAWCTCGDPWHTLRSQFFPPTMDPDSLSFLVCEGIAFTC